MEIQELEVLHRFQALQYVLRQVLWPALISLHQLLSDVVRLRVNSSREIAGK